MHEQLFRGRLRARLGATASEQGFHRTLAEFRRGLGNCPGQLFDELCKVNAGSQVIVER